LSAVCAAVHDHVQALRGLLKNKAKIKQSKWQRIGN